MARHQREALRALGEAERAEVERLSRSGSERADRVRRATALLAVAEGQPFVAAPLRSRVNLNQLRRDPRVVLHV
jgi:hypothetical protein